MTYKIKIKAITINNNIYMTDLKENESYLKKKNNVQNETYIFQLSTECTYDETAETYLFLSFFRSGLRGPNAYSLWGGVVPSPSIGKGNL